jgi:hypothetical protein
MTPRPKICADLHRTAVVPAGGLSAPRASGAPPEDISGKVKRAAIASSTPRAGHSPGGRAARGFTSRGHRLPSLCPADTLNYQGYESVKGPLHFAPNIPRGSGGAKPPALCQL